MSNENEPDWYPPDEVGIPDPRLVQTDNSGEMDQPTLPQRPDWRPNPNLLVRDFEAWDRDDER